MERSIQQQSLVARCGELLRVLGGLTRAEDSDWLGLDMGMGQFKAMIVLKEQGRQTVGGVARALKISEPSASLLVDKLVTRGMVVRDTDPGDRRRTLVALSVSGDDLMTRLRRSKEDRFAGWLSQLPVDDLADLAHGLEALVGVIEQSKAPLDEEQA
jgi:DNA-binding MarR family transcriptional regulator